MIHKSKSQPQPEREEQRQIICAPNDLLIQLQRTQILYEAIFVKTARKKMLE